jgi:type III restriction enzyme
MMNFMPKSCFEHEELSGYLSKNMLESEKSVYEYVVYDSETEKDFAQKFENNQSVKVYAKLPDWFKIETPLGNYNPDWAVLVDKGGEEKLYFVVETKGSTLEEDLRKREIDKMACGRKHFEALGSGAEFRQSDNFKDFMESI